MNPDAPGWFDQSAYRCRFAWGHTGARDAARRGDLLVIVDVLSFSTACALAVARGAIVYPCRPGEEASVAERLGGSAEVAVPRRDVPAKGRFSLSPVTVATVPPGTSIVVGSPNGAACARFGADAPAVLVGALVNARACADAVAGLLEAANTSAVTVIACGERAPEPESGEGLRFALEDLLGAGAVLAALPPGLARSPEARAAEAAFRGAEGDLPGALRGCGSGIELIERGYAGDVDAAARLDAVTTAGVLREGAFRPL